MAQANLAICAAVRSVATQAEVSTLAYVTWNGSLSGSDEVLIASGWQGALTMWGNYSSEDFDDGEPGLPHCFLEGHTADVTATEVRHK